MIWQQCYRQRFHIPTIGVTGSNGKTTCKEMLATILEQIGPGLKTAGNLNNLIGLPQMLFRLQPEHGWAVLEMGMSEPGEIDRLAEIAAPQIGNRAERLSGAPGEHGHGRGGCRVPRENCCSASALAVGPWSMPTIRVIASLPPESLSPTDQFRHQPRRGAGKGDRVARIGGATLPACHPKGRDHCSPEGLWTDITSIMHWQQRPPCLEKVELTVIAAGLEAFTPYKGRFQVERLNGITIIDDSYNANPASMKAALETLSR